MDLTADMVMENLFLAAFLLLVFSLPKIMILLGFSHARLKIMEYGTIKKALSNKMVKKVADQYLDETTIEQLNDPVKRMRLIDKEVGDTLRDAKPLAVEALIGILIIIIISGYFSIPPNAVLIISTIILAPILIIVWQYHSYVRNYLLLTKIFNEKSQDDAVKKIGS